MGAGIAANRATAIIAAAGLLIALIGLGYVRDESSRPAPPPAPRAPAPLRAPAMIIAPSAAFWHEPYMAVVCPIPDNIACDRIGLAVWLRHPARAVTATVLGKTLRLGTGPRSPSQWRNRPPRTGFAGYLQPAGLITSFHVTPVRGSTWFGAPTPVPIVRFRIQYRPGHVVVTKERVPLMAGWG